jgi:hypothetical protein
MHERLHAGRGAVAAVAEIDTQRGVLRYAGIGNISGSIWTDEASQSLVSMNGTMGHSAARARDFSYSWSAGALLVMHSDGLATRWSLADYPGLTRKNPSIVAGVLYRDFTRGRDDVTVVVARQARKA